MIINRHQAWIFMRWAEYEWAGIQKPPCSMNGISCMPVKMFLLQTEQYDFRRQSKSLTYFYGHHGESGEPCD